MTDITGGPDPEWHSEFDCEFGCMPMYHGEEPETPRPTECPTCGARHPSMHPAVSGGGEVTSLCPDKFHDGDPVTERARRYFSEREAAQRYIQARYKTAGISVDLDAVERLTAAFHPDEPDPWVTGSILIDPSDASATAVQEYMTEIKTPTPEPGTRIHRQIESYNKMISRNTEGSDPLVQEP
jgi:hypothetical protein